MWQRRRLSPSPLWGGVGEGSCRHCAAQSFSRVVDIAAAAEKP